MPLYRKRPVVIEAVQLRWSTWSEVCELVGDILSQYPGRTSDDDDDCSAPCGESGPWILLDIPTKEGVMTARHGDWIIKGVAGELYPCKPEIFAASYDLEGPNGERMGNA